MTNILAIETSGAACSVALYYGGETQQRLEMLPREHARKVLPMVDSLLAEAGVELSSLDALAYSRGPGSFTGLRIGFGVIQGLAFGADLPVVGVSSLQALALQGAREFGVDRGIAVPALDARMRELYWAVYELSGSALPCLRGDERASTPGDVLDALPQEIAVAVGDGWTFLDDCGASVAHRAPQLGLEAAIIAEMAVAYFQRGEVCPISEAGLSYVRSEISWKKRQRIRRKASTTVAP